MRQALHKYCNAQSFQAPIEIVSETFEATVARGILDGLPVFIKCFYKAQQFEAELIGLYHLQEARVPKILDMDTGELIIMMHAIVGRPFSSTDSLCLMFKFIGQTHTLGCKSLEREGLDSILGRTPILRQYQKWELEIKGENKSGFIIGDYHPLNFIITATGDIHRIDLATFTLGVPCSIDLLLALWHACDFHLLPDDPIGLLSSYMEGRLQNEDHNCISPLDITLLVAELDMLAPLYDKAAINFGDHYRRLRDIALSSSIARDSKW